jgi:hypothetical protein
MGRVSEMLRPVSAGSLTVASFRWALPRHRRRARAQDQAREQVEAEFADLEPAPLVQEA